jgi:hypothetical protein
MRSFEQLLGRDVDGLEEKLAETILGANDIDLILDSLVEVK